MSYYIIHDIRYQRNGVTGEGFFSVLLDYSETPRGTKTRLIAIMPEKYNEDSGDHEFQPEYTYVIDPTNLKSGWRGDKIGHDISAAVAANKDAAWPTLYPSAQKVFPIKVVG